MTNPFVGNDLKPAAPTNPFSGNTVRETTPEKRGVLDVATNAGRGLDAAKLAEADTLSRRTNLPWGTVYRNLDEVRRMAGDRTFKPDEFVRENPISANWLSDEMNAGVSQGDWSRMGTMERLVGSNWRMVGLGPFALPLPTKVGLLGREFLRGTAANELARLSFYSTPAERALLADRLTELRTQANADLPAPSGLVERAGRGMFRNVLPSMLSIGEEAATGAALAAPAGLAGGPLAPVTVTAAAGLGAVAGAFKRSVELIGGQAIDDFSQIRDANGDPMDPLTADIAGRTVGVLGAIPEIVGVGAIARPFANQASRLMATSTARALTTPTVATALRAGMRDWAQAMGTEVATEVIQQGIQLAGEQTIRMASDQPFEDIPLDRVTEELTTTAIETALSTFFLGAAGGVTTTIGEMGRVQEARETQARLSLLGENISESELRKRSPEKFAEWANEVVKDGPVRSVFIPVEEFTTYWQSQGVDPEQAASEMGATEAYQQAVATGGDVVVPFASYVANVAGTEHHERLVPNLRLRAGAMTLKEAEAAEKNIETEMAKLREEMESATPETDAEQAIVDDVVGQLTIAAASMPAKTRYTPEQIATMAEAIAKPYVVLGRRSKQDPLQLYRSRNIRIVGPESAETLFDEGQAAALQAAQLTREELDAYLATEAWEMKQNVPTMTARDIARELTVAPSRVEAWLAASAPALSGDALKSIGMRIAFGPMAWLRQAAFHGSPHVFDRFDLSKIGTGEGMARFGWGVNLSLSERVADGYRAEISRQRGLDPSSGSVYRVEVPDEAVARMLDWELPMAQQPESVQESVRQLLASPEVQDAQRELTDLKTRESLGTDESGKRIARRILKEWNSITGEHVYRDISDVVFQSDERTSKAMAKFGVAGIRHDLLTPDPADSKTLVVFDDALVTITHRNGEPVTTQERAEFLEQGQTETLPPTIEIDGVSRPTTNSNGQPIALTEQGVRNFYKWFGASKVVDAEGRPLVVYHGTDKGAGFDEFSGPTYWSTNPRESSAYAQVGQMVRREKARSRFIEAKAEGSLDGKRVEYIGIIDDIPRTDKATVWATDQGVVRVQRGKPIEVFTDVVLVDGGFDAETYTQELASGESVALETLKADTEELIQSSGATGGEGGRVYAAYLRIENPVELAPFAGNLFSGRLVDDFQENVKKVQAQGHDGVVTTSDEAAFSYEMQAELGEIPTQYVTFSPDQVKSATGNQGTFSPSDPSILRQGSDRPNAFLRLGVGENTIGLMKTANLSSVLHEFAHDWLNLIGDLATAEGATDDLKAEYAIVLKELGVTSKDQIGVKEQEHWARAFEKYLADGQAPSRPMARMFARFKAWMKQVYQAALDNFVPVSPELRGVFDRMLASETATDEALADTESLLDEQGPLTDAEFAAHQQAVADVKERSEAALLAKLLAESNPERREGWKERRAEIEAQVRAEVEAEPIQQAVAWMRNPSTPKEGKPSKQMLVARYGPDITKTLPRGTFTVDGGIDPDFIALSFGMESGDDLITQLQAYELSSAKIQRVTEERLRQEFPDLVNDSPALADEARKAVHAAVNDDVILTELKALGRSDASVPAPNIKAVKRVAAEAIDATPVRDLQPHRYLLAERKANRLAKEALRAGDIPKAAFHGRQQLLNHILYRYATKAVAMEQKALRFFSRMSTDAMRAKLGLAGKVYQDAMDALLNDYEFVRTSNVALDRKAKLKAWLDQMAEEGFPTDVPESVAQDAALRNYRTLTVGELQDVYDAGKRIHHIATARGKVLLAKRKRAIEALETELVEHVKARHEVKPRTRDFAPPKLQKVKDFIASADAWHTKPEFLFRWLDGDDSPFGPVHSALFQPLADSQSAEATMLRDYLPQLRTAFDAIPKAKRKQLLERTVIIGNTRLSGEAVLAMALNWGNQGNREALLAGEVDGRQEFSLGDIEKALATLTADEWRAVQNVWDMVDTLWPYISEMYQRLNGVAPQKVEAQPFTVTTADGQTIEMKGGYYPLNYDRQYSWTQSKQEAKEAVQTMGEWSYTKAATKNGFTEARVGSGGKPVRLDLNVLAEHVLNVIHDVTHREAVLQTNALIERPAVREVITQAAGAEMYAMLSPWLKRIASDRVPASSPGETLLGRARRGVTVVNMGFKATTALVQPLGYLTSLDHLGPKWFMRGQTEFWSNPKRAWEKAQGLSPELAQRRETFDRDVRDAIKNIGTQPTKFEEVQRAAFYFTGLMDMGVAVPTWWGAYYKSFESLKPGDQDAAVAYANSVVRETQSSGAAKDLAAIQGGTEKQRMFTMFYSYFSAFYNQMRRATRRVQGPKDVPRFLASLALLWILPAVIGELMAARPPEDDEDWAEWAGWQTFHYLTGSVVGIRDMANAVGPDSYDYELTPLSAAMEAIPELANAGIDFASGEEVSRSDLRSLVDVAGYWGQLPTRQGWITGTYLYDWMMGYESPETPLEAGRNLLFTRPR